jgi:hypothetical protein
MLTGGSTVSAVAVGALITDGDGSAAAAPGSAEPAAVRLRQCRSPGGQARMCFETAFRKLPPFRYSAQAADDSSDRTPKPTSTLRRGPRDPRSELRDGQQFTNRVFGRRHPILPTRSFEMTIASMTQTRAPPISRTPRRVLIPVTSRTGVLSRGYPRPTPNMSGVSTGTYISLFTCPIEPATRSSGHTFVPVLNNATPSEAGISPTRRRQPIIDAEF